MRNLLLLIVVSFASPFFAAPAFALVVSPGDLFVQVQVTGQPDSWVRVDPASGYRTEIPFAPPDAPAVMHGNGRIYDDRAARNFDPQTDSTSGVGPCADPSYEGGVAIQGSNAIQLLASEFGMRLRSCNLTSGAVNQISFSNINGSDVGAGPDVWQAYGGVVVEPSGNYLIAAKFQNGASQGYGLVRVNAANGDRTIVSAGFGSPQIGSGMNLPGFSGPAPPPYVARRIVLEPARNSVLWTAGEFGQDVTVYRIDLATGNRTIVSSCQPGFVTCPVGSGPGLSIDGIAVADDGSIFVVHNSSSFYIVGPAPGIARIDPDTGDRTLLPGLGFPIDGIFGGLVIAPGTPPAPLAATDSIGAGSGVTGSVLGGASTPGGIDALFLSTTGGTLQVEARFGPPGLIDDLLVADPVDFAIPTDPAVFWALDYDGLNSLPVVLTFGYDDGDLAPGVSENDLQILRFVPPFGGCTDDVDCGWVPLTKLSQDVAANTITVETPGFSEFGLGALPSATVPFAGLGMRLGMVLLLAGIGVATARWGRRA